jgi:hypothetical protein
MVEDMKKMGRQAIQEDREFKKKLQEMPNNEGQRLSAALMRSFEMRHVGSDNNLFVGFLRVGEGVSGFYFREALELAEELARSDDELFAFADELAEMMFVQWAYSSIHGQWHPTTNSSQDGNWKEHRDFLRALDKIAQAKYEERELDSV